MTFPGKNRLVRRFHGLIGPGAPVKIVSLLIVAFPAADLFGQWVPSGPYTYYNAELDRTRIVGGGPLRNYYADGAWRSVNPEFRYVGNWLVSDSGYHKVAANLTTNVVWLNWRGHYLGIEVAPLYACRASTTERTKLADPSFTSRSWDGSIITIEDVYPGVDLEIENDPDALKHRYHFHPAARTALETWWQNNGQHDDMWVVNTFRLHIDSLNCNWSDKVSGFTLDSERELTLPVRIGSAAAEFFLPNQVVELEATDGEQGSLSYRLLRIGGNAYLAEGFRWATVREWDAGTIGHYAVFGNKYNGNAKGAIAHAYGIADNGYQYTAISGDVVDSLYCRLHAYFGDSVCIGVAVYDTTSGCHPHNKIGEVHIISHDIAAGDRGEACDIPLTAGTTYTVAAGNSCAATNMFYNTEVLGDGSRADTIGLRPVWVEGQQSAVIPMAWAVYTTSGGGETQTRRRRLILGGK